MLTIFEIQSQTEQVKATSLKLSALSMPNHKYDKNYNKFLLLFN